MQDTPTTFDWKGKKLTVPPPLEILETVKKRITENPKALSMDDWHCCNSAHCIAGWIQFEYDTDFRYRHTEHSDGCCDGRCDGDRAGEFAMLALDLLREPYCDVGFHLYSPTLVKLFYVSDWPKRIAKKYHKARELVSVNGAAAAACEAIDWWIETPEKMCSIDEGVDTHA